MKKLLLFYYHLIITATMPALIYAYDDMDKIWHYSEQTPEDAIKDIRYLYNPNAIDFDEEESNLESFFNLLHTYAEKGDLAQLQQLLNEYQYRFNTRLAYRNGDTFFHRIKKLGQLKCAELIESYSNISWESTTITPQDQEQKFINAANWILTFYLFKYAQEGSLQALKELLDNFHNLNVQVKDAHQKTPANYAAQNGHNDCADLIRSHTPDSQSYSPQSSPINLQSLSYNADDENELAAYELFGDEEAIITGSSDEMIF